MRAFRKATLASVVLFAGASTAFAADAPTPPAPYSWTGLVVGAQSGYGWGVEEDNLSESLGAPVDHFRAEGPIGGSHLGYDFQFGTLVFGFISEVDATSIRGSTTNSVKVNNNGAPNCADGCTLTEGSLNLQNSWQAFLLGRAGIAFDRTLIFVSGGLVLGNDDESASVTRSFQYPPGSFKGPILLGVWNGSRNQTLVGEAIGLGVDYALDDHWRFGSEWRFADFAKGSDPANLVFAGHGGVHSATYKAGLSENLAVVDLSYRF